MCPANVMHGDEKKKCSNEYNEYEEPFKLILIGKTLDYIHFVIVCDSCDLIGSQP